MPTATISKSYVQTSCPNFLYSFSRTLSILVLLLTDSDRVFYSTFLHEKKTIATVCPTLARVNMLKRVLIIAVVASCAEVGLAICDLLTMLWVCVCVYHMQ